jgi:hypothetical protein
MDKNQLLNKSKKIVKKLEIDQSVRIEELNKDTILGIANKEARFTVIVPKKAKRALYEKFRCQGKPKKFAPYVFAISISEALRKAPFKSSDIVIDIEYPGYEQEIIKIIKQQYPEIEVYFTTIGKKSPAHFVAYGVNIKKIKADYRINSTRLLSILKKIKK